MKLWNTSTEINKQIERFTIGDDPVYDLRLARYDVIGSIAHAEMLHSINYLSAEELNNMVSCLQGLLSEIEKGDFSIDPGIEDIHSQVEFYLTEKIGETGKKIHLGRSRNDQIALDLKLYYRDFLQELKSQTVTLANTLISKADNTKDYLMPGYTHSQAGMVSSFGMWYASFAEALIDDIKILNTVLDITDHNPLGSAAGYGSSLPNDRDFTTQKMNFSGLNINPIYAQASRGKVELLMSNLLASMAISINRLASDICIYSNENYQFLNLPDAFTTGSSIMPHKKNPDVLELIRGKCNQLLSLPTRISMLLNNMQTGYHRDYQLLKEIVFPELDRVLDILGILNYCIPRIEEQKEILEDEKYKYCFSVEHIYDLVKSGMTFRDAYHQIKEDINSGKYSNENIKVDHSHIGSIGNLGLERLKEKLASIK